MQRPSAEPPETPEEIFLSLPSPSQTVEMLKLLDLLSMPVILDLI